MNTNRREFIRKAGLATACVCTGLAGEKEYKAFADCCTHGCRELNYLYDKEQLECSSFGKSAFTLNGKVIKGPAEDPLKTYSLQKTDNKINIKIS